MSDPKYPVERADLTRLPFRALAVVAKVIESGDRKYQAGDWIMAPQRIDGRRDLNSALRHIAEYVEGKDVDEDSGESPLAHAAARLLFVLEREARGIRGGGWRIGKAATTPAGLCGFKWSVPDEPADRIVYCTSPKGHVGDHSGPCERRGFTVPDTGPPSKPWTPLADLGEIARLINEEPARCTRVHPELGSGRWFACELVAGHADKHRFSIPYNETDRG